MYAAKNRLNKELRDVLHNLHAELNRVEILAAALSAFNAPVPDYEPRFLHLVRPERALSRFELGEED